MSLDEFYHHTKAKTEESRCCIPHYVGGRSQPTYPVTEGYARAVLIIHKPWHATDKRDHNDESCIPEFEAFLGSPDCPQTVKIPYERVKNRYIQKTTHKESVSEATMEREVDENDTETREFLDIVATFQEGANPEDASSSYKFDRGIDYDWGEKRFPVSVLVFFDDRMASVDTSVDDG
jgi:hypothetical protein